MALDRKMRKYLYLFVIIFIVYFSFFTPKQEPVTQYQEDREVTEYGDTIIRNDDGTVSLPCGDGNYVIMSEEHYLESRKKMKEYNEIHRNDPPIRKKRVIRIKQRVSASAWTDAGDLRSKPYDETEITTNVVVYDDDDDDIFQ